MGGMLDFETLEELAFYRLMLMAKQSTESVYLSTRREGEQFVDGAGRPLVSIAVVAKVVV